MRDQLPLGCGETQFRRTGQGLWPRLWKYDNRTGKRMGQERHCRIGKPCILAKRSLPSFAGLLRPANPVLKSLHRHEVRTPENGCWSRGQIRVMRDCEGSLTTTMARIILRSGQG